MSGAQYFFGSSVGASLIGVGSAGVVSGWYSDPVEGGDLDAVIKFAESDVKRLSVRQKQIRFMLVDGVVTRVER